MEKRKHLLRVILIVVISHLSIAESYSQDICKNWFSEEINKCMMLNETGFSAVLPEENIEFKVKDSLLILYLVYDPRPIFDRKSKFVYKIEKLTNDSLILCGIPGENIFEELQVAYQPVVFVSTPKEVCMRKYKDR